MGDIMKNRNKSIITIIILAVFIAVFAGLFAYFIYQGQTEKKPAETTSTTAQATGISAAELEDVLKQQMMYVNGINYYYQTSSPQLAHDAMGASVFNNSDVEIKQFVVSFCAFDVDGKPIKIVQPDEQGEGGYIRTISYDYANAQGDKKSLLPKETCKDILMYVKTEPQIVTVKACVKSYVSVDDITWENPYYKSFVEMYSGKNI